MPELILLVDDDPDAFNTVSSVLGAEFSVLSKTTLAKALEYLRSDAALIRGVIVDLNLVPGRTDNFGGEVLALLREKSIPCIVFSSTISSDEETRREQVELYKNQYGVLNAFGKNYEDAHQALRELREGVRAMVAQSLEIQRDRTRLEIDKAYDEARNWSQEENARMARVAARAGDVAGAASRRRFTQAVQHAEVVSQASLNEVIERYRTRLAEASDFDQIDQISADVRRELGY